MAELGYAVDLLTLPVGEEKEIPGVRTIRAPNVFLARNVRIGPSCLKTGFDLVLGFMAAGLALRNRYGVIHCVEDTGVIGVILAAITRSKLVFEKHSDPSSYRNGPLRNIIMWMYAHIERFTVRHADAVIGTGQGLVNQARAMGTGKPVHHIFDIPSSLAEACGEKTRGIRRALKKRDAEVLITFVGSFAVYQGVDLMFEAIPDVLERHPEARFVIIGGSPEEIRQRRAWLAERGVRSGQWAEPEEVKTGDQNGRDDVTFVGKVPPDELPDYLSASDILLSPRLAGVNTPLKLLDYLKAGRAIVATDTESNRLILDTGTAVLVRAAPSAFADGISRLMNDENLRSGLGANGRKLIMEKYNFTEFKKRLGQCYEEVLGTD